MATEKLVDITKEVPIINGHKTLKKYLKRLYIIHDYMVDKKTYEDFKEGIYNLIRASYVIKNCREYPVRFKFYKEDKRSNVMELRHFLINLMLWYPFVELNDVKVLNKSFILDGYTQIPVIDDFLNEVILKALKNYHVKSTKINYNMSHVLNDLRRISGDFSTILGLNISAPMFMDVYNTNEKVRNLMEMTFPDDAQPHEIEKMLNKAEADIISEFKAMPNNNLGIILRANTGVKGKQLREFTVAVGLKPTIEGDTIPITINNSLLINGVNTPAAEYIDGLGARKSLVLNTTEMGRAGYFGKTISLSVRSVSVSKTVSDCNTKHLVKYDVINKKILKKLHGKYYKIKDTDDLQLLDATKDKHLIGRTIKVRSAATCACGENEVCSRCIGHSIIMNTDIMDGFATYESEEITKVVNQSILSSKHLLSTFSEVIEFNEGFEKFFNITRGEITANVNNNQFIDNIDDYAIYIDPKSLVKVEEMDDYSLYNTVIESGRFFVRNVAKPDEPDIECTIVDENKESKEIFVTEDTIYLMKKGKGLVYFKDIDDSQKLFEVQISNNELTKPLYDIMHLINRNNKDNVNETIDSISNKFLQLLVSAGIDASVVAAELIINRLIRSAADIYRRPDFSEEELEPYEIVTVRKSLEKNKSPLIGIAFENIKRQILSDEFYSKRNGVSYIDPMFKKSLSTKKLLKYAKMAQEDYDTSVS